MITRFDWVHGEAMIPTVDRDALLQAMRRFDREFRSSSDWAGWEQNQAHKYAIQHDGRRYPVKQIVSLATAVPVSDFSGGEGPGHANQRVSESGFEVVPLRPNSPHEAQAKSTPSDRKSVHAYLDDFLTSYPDIRSSKSFGVDQELWRTSQTSAPQWKACHPCETVRRCT